MGDSQRIGDQLYIKRLSFRVRIGFVSGLAANNLSGTVRLTVVQYLGDTGSAVLTAAMVYQSVVSSTAQNFQTWDQKPLIKILYDKIRTVSNVGNMETLFQGSVIPSHKKLQFNAGGTNGKGHLYLLITGDQGSSEMGYFATSRLEYTDA